MAGIAGLLSGDLKGHDLTTVHGSQAISPQQRIRWPTPIECCGWRRGRRRYPRRYVDGRQPVEDDAGGVDSVGGGGGWTEQVEKIGAEGIRPVASA